MADYRRAGGIDGLKAKPTPGRPPKLTARQEKTVLGWVAKPPTRFGFGPAIFGPVAGWRP